MSSLRSTLVGLLLAFTSTHLAAVTLSQFNTAATENFDSLATSTGNVLPPTWQFNETGSSANATYGAGGGSSATGNTYSFGAAGSSDRALGGVRTTGVATTFGSLVTNGTGGTIVGLSVSFVGEQWRLGALGRVDRLDFGFSLDATSLASGNWTDIDALDFIAPVTAGSTGALDGNLTANRLLVSYTISGLSVPHGAEVWFRWVDFDASGSDDGLAIDDLSISALPAATTPNPGGGGAQGVPDTLPTGMFAAVMTAMLGFSVTRRRVEVRAN